MARFSSALCVALFLCAGLFLAAPWTTAVSAAPPVALGTQSGELPTLAPLLKKVAPSVVNIGIKGRRAREQSSPFDDPLLRRFLGLPEGQADLEIEAGGSGVVIDAQAGLIVTNYHVLQYADQITVTLIDGRELPGKRLGGDPETDVALIKVEAEHLTPIDLGDSDGLEVGDFVLAIGNPFQIGQAVTFGIVSGLRRSGLGLEQYEEFIQTDASINPGSSGGALINLRGELVGINTAIVGPTGGNLGIGFAIPVNLARGIVTQLLKHGDVRHGQLGIALRDVTADMIRAMGLPEEKPGAVISRINPGSPAEQAGLMVGDVVTALADVSVRGAADLSNKIGLLRVGEEAEFTVRRGTQSLTIKARLAERKKEARAE